MKNDINRNDLKHNFLKNIIVRFDYSGITDSELELLISKIKSLLHEKGYNKLTLDSPKEIDLQINDPETIEEVGLPVRSVRSRMVYVFTNDNPGIRLKISSTFALVSIEKTRYINFFDYSSTLLDVVRIIKDNTTFFSGIRFGLQKINQCILKDISLLNKYFEPDFYRLFTIGDHSTTKLFQAKDCVVYDGYNCNLSRTVVKGEYKGKIAYQIVLDSDIYLLDSEKIEDLIHNSNRLTPMNSLLFDIYKSAITEEFLNKLQQELFSDSDIIGVENNERV